MIWLILCTVGYGSVWAWDGHVDEAAEHHMVGDAGHAPDADEDNPACDHCCHASAHIMALCPVTIGTSAPSIGAANTPYLNIALLHFTAPPDQPPRS